MVAAEIGARVSCEGFLGTIRYIGDVPPASGIWWGIEWDDENRGKHGGSHNGVRYFQTYSNKSGSFVRPTKCSLGISLLEAVIQKYVSIDDEEAGPGEMDETIIGTLENKEVLFVGMSSILKEQRSLNTLKHINLRKCDISHAGTLQNVDGKGNQNIDFNSKFPSTTELDLSENLFSDWNEILNIVANFPALRIINLQGNIFSKGVPTMMRVMNEVKIRKQEIRNIPDLMQSRADGSEGRGLCRPAEIFLTHKNIREVCLNNLNIDWENLLCFCILASSHVETLVASFNRIVGVDLEMHASLSEQLSWRPLSTVISLNLEGNPIGSWSKVLKLDAVMPSLKTLVLNSCNLEKVHFDSEDVESGSPSVGKKKANLFSELSTISLSRNKIFSWESINELNRLQSLQHLIMTSNPVDGGSSTFDSWGHKVVARIAGLTHLNRVKVDKFERRGAEIDYLRACFPELNEASFHTNHPRYEELVKKFGTPDVVYSSALKSADLKANLLRVNIALVKFDANNGENEALATFNQRLPKTMTVGKLKQTIKRMFKKDLEKHFESYDSKDDRLSLSYSSCDKDSSNAVKSESYEIPMDDLFKEIGYYSLNDGDSIYVRSN